MSLAIDLYRGHAHPTQEVERWLRQREWAQQHQAGRVSLWTHEHICRDACDITEALIRTAVYEAEHGVTYTDDWRTVMPPSNVLRTQAPLNPPRKRERRDRLAGAPRDDEDLFRG